MIAAGFVANGARVYIASRSKDACEAAAKKLTAEGPGTCVALSEDLSTEAGCVNLAKMFRAREDRLHVLVNNSGTSWGAPLEKHSEKGWDKVYALNVKGIFFLTRAAPRARRGIHDDGPGQGHQHRLHRWRTAAGVSDLLL